MLQKRRKRDERYRPSNHTTRIGVNLWCWLFAICRLIEQMQRELELTRAALAIFHIVPMWDLSSSLLPPRVVCDRYVYNSADCLLVNSQHATYVLTSGEDSADDHTPSAVTQYLDAVDMELTKDPLIHTWYSQYTPACTTSCLCKRHGHGLFQNR